MPACNICGGYEFVPGPNNRLSPSGAPPQCGNCRSLERQRSLRECLSRVPEKMLSWRRAIQFAPDRSLDPAWFRSFETSVYGGENSIDLQQIDLPDGSYDFISLGMVLEFVVDDRRAFGELVRVGSGECIIHHTFGSTLSAPASTHYDEPYGTFGRHHDYGSDLEQWLETTKHGLWALVVQAVDPVTATVEPIHFFCRQAADAERLSAAFAAGEPAFDVSVRGPVANR
jgi:Methyltransferase domain